MADVLLRHDHGTAHWITANDSALCVAARSADACRDGVWLAAIQGQYAWTDGDLRRAAGEHGAARALLDGFRTEGTGILERLSGSFSLCVLNDSQAYSLLATDRLGIEPVNWVEASGALVFASDVRAMGLHPAVIQQVNPQAIFNYLYFHVVPAPLGVFMDHKRLLPGSFVERSDGKLRVDSYWEATYQEHDRSNREQDLKEELHALIKRSVEDAARTEKPGCFLSGGTDSSTVTGMLGAVSGAAPETYTIGFDAEGYDEMEYARTAARHFGADHHEYYVTPEDVVEAIPKIAGMYGEPFGNSSAVPAYYCARLAGANGITRLLAGDGGDELFAGNERYAKQQVFGLYERVPQGLRSKLLEPLVSKPIIAEGVMPLRKLHSYVAQASVPMPARLETYNLLERLGVDEVFDSEFKQQIDTRTPLAMLEEHYGRIRADTLLNKMLGLDLKFTLADNDLPKVSKMCELAGVEVAYPLLSDELVAFASRLPPSLKLRRGKLRYFFKEALRGFLPDETINKSKQGFGLPFGYWLARHPRLSEFATDNMAKLKSRGIVRPEFVDELMRTHLPSHPHFYGSMVWLLIMLEQWFAQHVDAR